MVPPDHLLAPSAFKFQRMVMPFTGLFLLAPSQPSQTGFGPLSECRMSTTLPVRVPLAAWVISTIDFTLPVLSSMVFQRPAAPSAACAESAARHSGNASSRVLKVLRMVPSQGSFRHDAGTGRLYTHSAGYGEGGGFAGLRPAPAEATATAEATAKADLLGDGGALWVCGAAVNPSLGAWSPHPCRSEEHTSELQS